MHRTPPQNPTNHRWPEGAVVYQIYPRSFQDSNGDGIGDLPGIISRLGYLQDLGVNALWLSPCYPSPMADFGYDIADYCNIDPIFGTLDDCKTLIAEAHARNIRILMDLVPNHTSDAHPWFQASRTSKDNEYSNWYVWKDAHPDPPTDSPQPPNNWRDALTGGSAWQWVPERGQFYLHSFDVRQPDLNWSNQEVREAIKDVMRFWLDAGVDGFRVDAVYWMAKDPLFRDDAANPDYVADEDHLHNALAHNNSQGWPPVYAYLMEMAEVLKEGPYRDRQAFMVTEAYPEQHNSLDTYMAFYDGMDPAVAAPFNFEGLRMPWKASQWRQFLKTFHCALTELSPDCVASYAFGNHDKPRLATRLGTSAARSAAVMQLTLPGMIFIYYGEEIGMHNVPIPPERVQDPGAQGDPRNSQGRDPARTPMQWSARPQAGFSGASDTWLPVGADYQECNVESQQDDASASLTLYRCLIHTRQASTALRYGSIEVIDTEHPNVLAYIRRDDTEAYVVLINFSGASVTCRPATSVGELVISSEPHTKLAHVAEGEIELLAHEAALFRQ